MGRGVTIGYDSPMIRPHLPLLAAIFAAIASTAFPQAVRADDGEADALLTLEGEAALRDRLWERVLLVTVKPAGEPMEDTSLIPEKFGQAARVTRDGKVEILTAGMLVEGAQAIRVVRTGRRGEGPAKAQPTDPANLLARLECDGPCAQAPALEVAPPEAWEPMRLLFFVLPGLPDQPILSHTESIGRQGTPFEAMIAVPGVLPPGTLLFDVKGRVVAVTVRGAPTRANWTLAAAMVLPKPEPVEEAAPEPETRLGAPGRGERTLPPSQPERKPEPARPGKSEFPEPIYFPMPPDPAPSAPVPGSPR